MRMRIIFPQEGECVVFCDEDGDTDQYDRFPTPSIEARMAPFQADQQRREKMSE